MKAETVLAGGPNVAGKKRLQLGAVIGSGGEGMVYEVVEEPLLVAKIYHAPTPEYTRRLEAMLQSSAETWIDQTNHVSVVWPMYKLFAENDGVVIGHLMYRLPPKSTFPLSILFSAEERRKQLGTRSWSFLLTVAADLATVVDRVHGEDLIVGDLADDNILFNRAGRVTLIDCTSMQFRAPGSNLLFPCPVTSPPYCPPELFGVDFNKIIRSKRSDAYSLAILICRLLMEGQHPFFGVSADGDQDSVDSIEENIFKQNTWFVHPNRMKVPPWSYAIEMLPPAVLKLARECFGPGHTQSAPRPTARQWADALSASLGETIVCSSNPLHAFHRSLGTCLWCDRVDCGLPDQYSPGPPLDHPHTVPGATPEAAAPAEKDEPPPPTSPQTGNGIGKVLLIAVFWILAAIVLVVVFDALASGAGAAPFPSSSLGLSSIWLGYMTNPGRVSRSVDRRPHRAVVELSPGDGSH